MTSKYPPLISFLSVWFSLCTLLVLKRIELSAVFFSFVSCFFLFSLISGGKCHPSFPTRDNNAVGKKNYKSIQYVSNETQILSWERRITNTIIKSIVGLVITALSLVVIATATTTAALTITDDGGDNTNRAEFRALALLTGYLIFDLCHAPYCRPARMSSSPSSLWGVFEDAASLTFFTVVLVRHSDGSVDLGRYKTWIVLWVCYKVLRLVRCIVVSRRLISDGSVTRCSKVVGSKTKFLEEDVVETKKKAAVRDANDSTRLWMIHGIAYDLEDFVERHPGGKEAIELGRGRDCTALFESYHPFTNKHRQVLQRYAKKNVTIPMDPFYETLKKRVITALKDNGIDPVTQRCATKLRAVYYLTILTCLLLSARYHIKASPLGSFLFAITGWLIGSAGHDGGHFAVSRSPSINSLSLWGMSLLCNPMMWQHQHTYAHHSHTNDFDHDPDLHHFTTFMTVHRRFSQKGMYKYQTFKLYVFWAYTFVVFGECLWIPMNMMMEGSLYGMVEWTDRKRPARAFMMAFHLVTYFLVIVLSPFFFSTGSLSRAGLCVVIHLVTSGLCFAVFSQINHLNELSLETPNADCTNGEVVGNDERVEKEFCVERSWAARQVQTSSNFATGSAFWHFLSNGLNLQIEHHLFPSLNHCHLHLVAPQVKRTCEEFGVCYKTYESWGELMDTSLAWFEKIAPSCT
eukprot:CAMPEP_0172492852 /NCGR_PEP_ID=MMETSP1066-20121228/24105_1 /TAXON_ID=671091 /ORGANISM="Coscinodiscus wailesii, Strain CCMP2513" /LENGTH=687 /DNA_ID=CAMNT_0013262685 /DNA_START=157 /DNA_END=2220 /DNA_ORIENTATION=-